MEASHVYAPPIIRELINYAAYLITQ